MARCKYCGVDREKILERIEKLEALMEKYQKMLEADIETLG
jgi:hypothetical protein